ncbi:MAG: hypothetical protein WCW35_04905 [Bacteroidota bacterium]
MDCLLCGNKNIQSGRVDDYDKDFFNCPICGKYVVTGTLIPMINRWSSRFYILSGVIKNATFTGRTIELSTTNIDNIISSALVPKSLTDYLIETIRFIGDMSTSFANPVEVNPTNNYPFVFAKTPDDFIEFIIQCEKLGYLETIDSGMSIVKFNVLGWQRYEEIKSLPASNPKHAFMAMQYGDSRLDAIYKDKFKPAVELTGFQLVRLDERPEAGLIDNRLRVDIRNCRFLLADVTNENKGAYWEAGYAEGLGKQVIYLCDKKDFDAKKVHFDVNHHTTIIWDEADLDTAAENLKATIRATFPSEAIMTD